MLTLPGLQFSGPASLLAFALTLYYQLSPDLNPNLIIDTPQVESEYDFIIIGAGSAGAVVANRLSEVGNWSVLLLEAGGQGTVMSEVPLMSDALQQTDLDWQYNTQPPKDGQAYCLSMNNHSCNWPRGKAIGGSSLINYMFYVRGNKQDFNFWESLGNEGWGYDNVLKYFLKSENNSNPNYLQTPYHSSEGPLSVQNNPYTSPMADTWLKAGEHLGYKHRDINGEEQTGFWISQATQRDGRRCSTAKAFIKPVQKRPNLSISMHSFVTKILFEEVDSVLTAKTVSFIKGDEKYFVRARKEIILSAGALNSPKILMLSGIGPEDHLNELGIEVVKNLKVGHNLQDHLSTATLTFRIDKPNLVLKTYPLGDPNTLLQWVLEGKGTLASQLGIAGMAFVNTKYADPSGTFPDIQLYLDPRNMHTPESRPLVTALFNLRPDLFEGTEWMNLEDEELFLILPVLLRPESSGRLSLKSKNPYDPPVINPNYLSQERDLKVMVEGLKIALKVAETPPFKALNATPLAIPWPGCEKHVLFSDEHLECLIRQFSITFWHPSCTCAMGVGPNAVVDPRLRVHGVKGLRVIDASIMPNVTSGNTNAPTIMIGEKGADLIKEDWANFTEVASERVCKKGEQGCSIVQKDPIGSFAELIRGAQIITET